MTKEITLNETLGVSKESILNKEHNLWIGFSFGNKWFTKENLERLIGFGLKYTKESLLVCIPSRLYATNLRYIDKLSRAESLRRAFEIGDEKFLEVKNIESLFVAKDRDKIIIAKYDDILTSEYLKQREVLLREFAEQKEFYKLVIDVSSKMLELRARTVSKERSESVALFILQELPLLIDGVMKMDTNKIHTVILYPGLGKLDELVMKIRDDSAFKLLRGKLNIQHSIGIASVG